jgi:predicted phage baseplate assembly protein
VVPATQGLEPVRVRVPAQEGRTVENETLGISNGYAGQNYLLARTSVLNNSISITSELGGSTYDWVEISDLREASAADRVFKTRKLTDGKVVVYFGDGYNGAIPDLHSILKVRYRVGGGASGNVAPLSVNAIVEPVIYGISVTNPEAATGGISQESAISIRRNAARAFRSRGRAVTAPDYVSVLLSLLDVHRAKAVGNNGSSITCYVVPTSDDADLGNPPTTTLTQQNRLNLTSYLLSKAMAGVSVSVFGPAWVQIYIRMSVYLYPSASQNAVNVAIQSRMEENFGYDSIDFDQKITVQSVMRALDGVEGIDYVEVENLSLDPAFEVPPGESPVRTIDMTESGPNAVPYWDGSSSLVLSMFGGVA